MVRTKCSYTIGDYAEVDQIMGDLILIKLNFAVPSSVDNEILFGVVCNGVQKDPWMGNLILVKLNSCYSEIAANCSILCTPFRVFWMNILLMAGKGMKFNFNKVKSSVKAIMLHTKMHTLR